jgi:hypothetical protein
MNTAMKEIQEKLLNQEKVRGLEEDAPKPALHPKHDHINKVRFPSSPQNHGPATPWGFCAPPCFPVVRNASRVTRAGS